MSNKLKPAAVRPKLTKILATLGPVSAKPAMMLDLLAAGVDAFRLNCSHATMAELDKNMGLIRSLSRQSRRACSVVMDLQGPRLRVGRLRNGEPIELRKGARTRISTADIPGTAEEFSTSFKKLPQTVTKNMEVRLDDGSIVLRVIKTGASWVDCEVVIGGLCSWVAIRV